MSRRDWITLMGPSAALALSAENLCDLTAETMPAAEGQAEMDLHRRAKWWREAKFGMFIHWGIYSLLGRGEQVLFREHLVPSQYRKLANRFTAPKFDAHEWVAMARDAGMRYMVLTSKHHDGFCLFQSKVSKFTSVEAAAKHDFVAEYAEACRRAGMRVGIYYSLADWSWPVYFSGPQGHEAEFAEFVHYIHTQVKEICSNYGRIDELWFDGDWPYTVAQWKSEEMEQAIRRLQPQVMINDRLTGGGARNLKSAHSHSQDRGGDFDTAEQKIATNAAGRLWESCQVTQHFWWGYVAGERHWKSPIFLIYLLAEAAGWGGNFLLNVGPKGDGSFPVEVKKQLAALGHWTRRHGEALYGTYGANHLFEFLSTGHMTEMNNTLYLWVLWWQGEELHLCGLKNDIVSARVLGHNTKVQVHREGEHIYLRNLPPQSPDPFCTVIALELDGKPASLPWAKYRLWGDNPSIWTNWART